MDRLDSPGFDVIGDVTEDDAVLQGNREVLGKGDPESALDLLKTLR